MSEQKGNPWNWPRVVWSYWRTFIGVHQPKEVKKEVCMNTCKVCGRDLDHVSHSEVAKESDKLYVIEVGGELYLMNVGDALCSGCNSRATWYKNTREV